MVDKQRFALVPEHGDPHGRSRPDTGRLRTRIAPARWEEVVELAKNLDTRA